MHLNLNIVVDKLATASYPDIPAEIKDWALNEAQIRIIKTKDMGNNPLSQGFQQIQRITDDLNNLLKTVEIVPTLISQTYPKIYKVSLGTMVDGELTTLTDGNKYMFFKRGMVQTSSDNCSAKYVKPKEVNLNSLSKMLDDPFNKPIITEPLITFEDGGIYIYADVTFNVTKFKLTYLKMPVKMSIFDNISCELNEHLHSEIVNLAGEILLEEVESGRLQTNMIINQKQ